MSRLLIALTLLGLVVTSELALGATVRASSPLHQLPSFSPQSVPDDVYWDTTLSPSTANIDGRVLAANDSELYAGGWFSHACGMTTGSMAA